jgi:hypothetical protein
VLLRAKPPVVIAFAPLGHVIARLNQQFPFEPRTAQYFTIFYGVLDIKTWELQC